MFDLSTIEPAELIPHGAVVAIENGVPAVISERRRPTSGIDDVSEQDGCKNSIDSWSWTLAGEELRDLLDDWMEISGVIQIIIARHFDELSIRDVVGKISRVLDRRNGVPRMKDKSRD
jgi:hypothetical protein